MSIATVGVLGLLSAGGGIWSGLTGPRIADVQLRDAASNTVAEPSFVATVNATIKETSSGTPFGSPASGGSSIPASQTSTSKETVVYQAPDRVDVKVSSEAPGSGQSPNETDLIQIGSSCWQPPSQLSASSGPQPCQASSISMFLELVRGLEKSSSVTQRDGMYDLSPADGRRFLVDAFLGGSSVGVAPKNVSVQVRIQGSDVVWEHLSFGSTQPLGLGASGGKAQTITVTFDLVARITQIGSAPPIVRPAGPPTSTG